VNDAGHDDDGQVEEEFRSLLEGLRTTLPGAQIITAFLLTLPFYERFGALDQRERVAYYIAFVAALVSSLLLMAPSSHQRLRSGEGVARQHRRHLDVAVRITIVGTVGFVVAVTSAAFLVSSLVLSTPAAVAITGAVLLTAAWSWFYLPLVSFRGE
jgi:cobalamin synthase